MKTFRQISYLILLLLSISCNQKDKSDKRSSSASKESEVPSAMPVDRGFTEYVAAYTSGMISVKSVIEIQLTPEFATGANKESGNLFSFDPEIRGRTEWSDDVTIVFTPARPLEPGKLYSGELNLSKLGKVPERLSSFPIRFQTLKRDFTITPGFPECVESVSDTYSLSGTLDATDFIDSAIVESFLTARLDRKKLDITWDHSDQTSHRFTVKEILRNNDEQKLRLQWDGTHSGTNRKGSSVIAIPPARQFSVIGVKTIRGENQGIDIIFSDPVDPEQDLSGLVYLQPGPEVTATVKNNVVTIMPSIPWQQESTIYVESSVKNNKGITLSGQFSENIDLTVVNPGLKITGKGVILPVSKNLIFPFNAAGLKAVDLTIIKVFENNLPHFLQENELEVGYNMKRFGRPVYRGKIDLPTATSSEQGWKLHTINLADYIDVEPGILYKVRISMRRSYAITGCENSAEDLKYDELLKQQMENSVEMWDNPDIWYEDYDYETYYSMDYSWEDREDPCKGAYYSPDKNISRNILASNLGLIAKKGEDDVLRIMVNDIPSALPVSEVKINVYDFQLQEIAAGTTNQDGSASIMCGRKPFLVIAAKDKDRNYLKLNDGNALSMSSFDVGGSITEKGIKVFIYGERDVWRPGDTIFLALLVKDLNRELPPDHPVQFELINSLGQRIDNQIAKLSGKNQLNFITKTPDDAITGSYQANFRIGGASFSKRIRIETIKPNRLKINLSFADNILGTTPGGSIGSLNVKWMNGNNARDMKASVDYLLKHTKTEFEKYRQFTFDDPAAEFTSETVNIFDSNIDEAGNAKFMFSPSGDQNPPGMLNAIFTVKVQEPGGDESITQTSYRYAPYKVFAGINMPGLKGKSRMLFTDEENEVNLVTVDVNGKPVKTKVELELYKLSYRWWWESDNENLGYYISNRIYKPVLTKSLITDSDGKADFKFLVDKNEWGRYLVRATVPGGHSSGKILLIDWPWEYGMKGNADGATLLSVNTNKEKYAPGDDVSLTFPSMENARAIITIENSTGVLEEIRIPAGKATTEVKFRARPEMAPNVYAYVSVIQPHSQSVNDMPVRLYGVVPVMVEDPETRLEPVITTAKEIRSQSPFEIKVSENGNKPMTYTLAVVDEGLLDITGFKTPDPWNHFYSREALGVQTWDLYDNILGAYGGTLDRILAVGGDEALADKSAGKAQRFRPVVKFSGPFTLQAGKTNTHKLSLPQYTGSVRAMVVAGNDKAFGSAETSILVRDPLMVLVTAPRVISPGDKAALPLSVFVQKEGIREITLEAEGNDLIKFDETRKVIPVTTLGEVESEFIFLAGEKRGKGKIKVTASGGGERADYELEIDVRSPNPPEARSEIRLLEPGEKWETTFKPFGIEGTNSATLELSGLPSVNLEKRLGYLLQYPHGCSEQITSAAFPQIWIKTLSGNDASVVSQASANIKKAISLISSRQMESGGIALWPNASQPDNWVTSYAGHFMLEAEKAGYNIPSVFRQKWISYQKKAAQAWRPDKSFRYTSNDQAYRLFTLALAGQPDKGAMNRMRETADVTSLSRWLLAAAFATTGRPEVAGDLLDVRDTMTESEYQNYYYGSEIRDKSIILYTLLLIKNKEHSLPLLNSICQNLNSEQWFSTQSIAWSLFSYMKWSESIGAGSGNPLEAAIKINGEKSEQKIGSAQLWKKEIKVIQGNNTIALENNSGSPLYATITNRGIPLVSDDSRTESGLSLKAEYYDLDKNQIDISSLPQGKDFMMVLKITNTTFSKVSDIALTAMIPSGWEIQNTRLFEAAWGITESAYDYRDFRDDRVNTYFLLNRGETKTFVLVLNAAYRGEYKKPSIKCEAMYLGNIYSRIPGAVVRVTAE